MFSMRFCALLLFKCVFDYSGRRSWEFISKPINCKQTSLPLKRRNIFLLQGRFVFH